MAGLLGAGQALNRGRSQHRAVTGLAAAVSCALVCLSGPALACFNSYDPTGFDPQMLEDPKLMAKAVADAELRWRESPTLENTNDLALARILSGRSAEGIQMLRDLEKRHPGEAKVAANLGTALELTGADSEALQWLRASVQRDPHEHQGSEWIHVRILEAKLALRGNPDWLRTNSVVGWREDLQSRGEGRSLARAPMELFKQIEYQLAERTRFVQPPDPIVGDLYLTLGDIAHSFPGAFANGWQRDIAQTTNYSRALEFGTVHEVRVRERLEAANRRLEDSREERMAESRRNFEVSAARAEAPERERHERQVRDLQRQEQAQRRQLALWVFLGLAALVSAGVFWRRRRASRNPNDL